MPFSIFLLPSTISSHILNVRLDLLSHDIGGVASAICNFSIHFFHLAVKSCRGFAGWMHPRLQLLRPAALCYAGAHCSYCFSASCFSVWHCIAYFSRGRHLLESTNRLLCAAVNIIGTLSLIPLREIPRWFPMAIGRSSVLLRKRDLFFVSRLHHHYALSLSDWYSVV